MLCPTYVVNFYKRYPLIILRPATIRIVIPEAYPQPDNNKNPINNNEITFFFFFFTNSLNYASASPNFVVIFSYTYANYKTQINILKSQPVKTMIHSQYFWISAQSNKYHSYSYLMAGL